MRALLIIDVQQGLFDGAPLLHGEEVVARIAGLVSRARAAKVPVFFVQHDGGPGDETDPKGPGFAFRKELTPQPGDPVTVKTHCNGFYKTDLEAKLRAAGIDELIVCGMQTEYCVDTTVRAAFDRGYRLSVVRDAHTTKDSSLLPAETIIAHTERLWDKRFATLVRADEVTFA